MWVWFALSYSVTDIALLVYIIVRYKGEIDDAPAHLLLALDHMMFIGVMTNSLFGLVESAAKFRRWSRVDNWVFWTMNTGLVGIVTMSARLSRLASRTSTA